MTRALTNTLTHGLSIKIFNSVSTLFLTSYGRKWSTGNKNNNDPVASPESPKDENLDSNNTTKS